jgi:hypothetical protein
MSEVQKHSSLQATQQTTRKVNNYITGKVQKKEKRR